MMAVDKMQMFRNRLTKVFRHVRKQAKRFGVSCYRIYDHDLPEFPFCIEIYDINLYVAEYSRRHGMTDDEHDQWIENSLKLISEVLNIPVENIFLKLRQRKAGRLGQYQKFGDVQHEFVVTENGLKFIVNLSDYLDTGLFLDHRVTRQLTGEQCNGKKMLNLFAYTGSFSVYAAAGGATEVVTVDLSNTYLKWADRNMKLNGFDDESKYTFTRADVKQYLQTAPTGYFDMVVMDPPTFSNSKRMDDFLDIQKDHVLLINQCMNALVPGGSMYFSTNFRKFGMDRANIQAGDIKDITRMTTPFDFEGKLSRCCYRVVK